MCQIGRVEITLISGRKLLDHRLYSDGAEHASGTANRIIYIIYACLIAVIFRGSCAPLYSSPRTKGTNGPDFTLLI